MYMPQSETMGNSVAERTRGLQIPATSLNKNESCMKFAYIIGDYNTTLHTSLLVGIRGK